MHPIQACLFDIGNVLVTFDAARTFAALAPRTPRTFAEIQRHLHEASPDLENGQLSTEAFIARALDFFDGSVTREAFIAAFTGIFEPILPSWQLVETISAAVPVYLFSNTSELHETSLFRDFPVFSRCQGGFYSWRLGAMKPGPEMYAHALATLKVPAASIAYIDDLPANIETGRRFGFQSHQYDRHRHDDLLAFISECGLPLPHPARST